MGRVSEWLDTIGFIAGLIILLAVLGLVITVIPFKLALVIPVLAFTFIIKKPRH
jgi:hypothetical protein